MHYLSEDRVLFCGGHFMKLKIYLHSGEYIVDPVIPMLMFVNGWCVFTDSEGMTHSVPATEITAIQMVEK